MNGIKVRLARGGSGDDLFVMLRGGGGGKVQYMDPMLMQTSQGNDAL
jgi:hypothetical protein